MILRIFILFLFVVLLAFILYFIYAIFIPAVKSQTVENTNPLFSEVELNYVDSSEEKNINVSDKKAFVLCCPDKKFKKNRLDFNGIKNCKLFSSIYETTNDCTYGCIGYGDCVKVCPQEAIIIKNNTAVITKNCCGCGECVNECPKGLIKLFNIEEVKKMNTLKMCNAPDTCLTSCNKFHTQTKIQIPEEKNFKFWDSCYKMLLRK